MTTAPRPPASRARRRADRAGRPILLLLAWCAALGACAALAPPVQSFERRSADRSGTYAHENPEAELAPELQAILDASPAAVAFLAEATPGYRKAVRHWIVSAKRPDTRERRARQLVACCAAGELIPPQRPGRTPAWLARAAAAAARE